MKRASTGNDAKRSRRGSGELSFGQRLTVAGAQAINAHARVRWLAKRLGEELENAAPREDSAQDLDPADPMVVAVANAATTMKSVTASMAAVSAPSPAPSLPSTKPGIGPPLSTKPGVGAPPPSKPPVVKTRLGMGTGQKKPDED